MWDLTRLMLRGLAQQGLSIRKETPGNITVVFKKFK